MGLRRYALTVTVLVLASTQQVAIADEGCGLRPRDSEIAATPRWVDDGNGLELVADLPEGSWEIQAEVSLGPLKYDWTLFVKAEAGIASVIDLQVPSAAWLDDLAATYVTNLVVKLRGTTGDAAGIALIAPQAFLAWPSGQAAGPVVWDMTTQRSEAPLGVLDESVRSAVIAALGDEAPTRILPPIVRAPAPRYEEE
jgi:hypothetical protein